MLPGYFAENNVAWVFLKMFVSDGLQPNADFFQTLRESIPPIAPDKAPLIGSGLNYSIFQQFRLKALSQVRRISQKHTDLDGREPFEMEARSRLATLFADTWRGALEKNRRKTA